MRDMTGDSLTKLAVVATLHCLSGCAIGEVTGSVIGAGLNWSNLAITVLTVLLAFCFGYALTMRPLLQHGLSLRQATRLAVASDTLSIGTMEIVDTAIMLLIPGAWSVGPGKPLFWASLAGALLIAFVFAV